MPWLCSDNNVLLLAQTLYTLLAQWDNLCSWGIAYDNTSCPRGTTYDNTGCLGGQLIATQVVLGDHLWRGPLVA